MNVVYVVIISTKLFDEFQGVDRVFTSELAAHKYCDEMNNDEHTKLLKYTYRSRFVENEE